MATKKTNTKPATKKAPKTFWGKLRTLLFKLMLWFFGI